MTSVGWLRDGTEKSLRSALADVAPDLAGLPIRINPRHAASNPLWWSSSAVVDGRFVVKFAWSEVRARRLWREGAVLERLHGLAPSLPLPEVVAVSREPALVVTRLVTGEPLSSAWAGGLTEGEMGEVARQLAGFLVRLHGLPGAEIVGGLPVVDPTPQADTGGLRDRFGRLVDGDRAASVMRWCGWVDDVLGSPHVWPATVVHGDLHGYNQVWDRGSSRLLAVVDFEESGIADPTFDLRYLPGNARGVDLVLGVINAYERLSGRRLAIERVMAWHLLTALGDALWRSEAGVALPDGGSPVSYVDELAIRLDALELA